MLQVTTLDPARCTWSRAGYEVCVWKLGDRNGAWYALAESIPTKARVNLICEFPANGAPRERECAPLPAVSPPTTGSSSRRVRISASEAQSRLDAAGTVWELTMVVGDVPERCSNVDANTKFCVWRATGHTQGFATLVPLLEKRARPAQLHAAGRRQPARAGQLQGAAGLNREPRVVGRASARRRRRPAPRAGPSLPS